MGFFRFLHGQKLFIHYLTILIFIAGIFALLNIQREARPNVNFNRVAVSVAYPGASPEDIEELLIDPIEEKIAEVDGVKEFRSVSFSGAGSISVEIDDTYPDVDDIIDEIRRKVGEVSGLPSNVEDPIVTEIKASNIPVLRLALYGDLAPLEMKMEVEKLKDYLSTFSGVSSVSYDGLADLQLKILTSPEKLDAYDLTLLEILSSVTNWAKQKPGGLLENSSQSTNITIGSEYDSIERLNSFVVQSNDSGRHVSLKNVAAIRYDTETVQNLSSFAGKNATLMTIVKKPNADIVDTVEGIKAGLESYSRQLPKALKVKLYTDESVRVRIQLATVANNAIFGLILVLVVLVINLDWRSAIVTSMGIPVAILGGVALIYLMGSTLNSLVLIGMIVVLGMLVDDAIVVCENIYRHLEEGLSPSEAAIKGVSEIAIPVLATVTTTVLAFLPIVFMQGIMGQFISVIPVTVIAMLLVSLFEALIILPVHADELMKTRKKSTKSLFARLEKWYERYLSLTIRYKWLVLLLTVGLFAGTLVPAKQLFSNFTLFPATGLTGISIRLEAEKNTPIQQTAELANILSQRLDALSGGDFDSVYANIGSVTTGGADGTRQSGSHLGAINIVFTSDPSFIEREKALLGKLREATRSFSEEHGVQTSITISRPGPPVGKPIQFQITARDFTVAEAILGELKSIFGAIEGVHSMESDADGNTKKYRFLIDNNFAISEGVDPENISRTIFAASTGRVTNEITKSNQKVEILVGVKSDADYDISDLLKLKVRNQARQAVPIGAFVKVAEESGPSSIQRLDRIRTLTFFAEVDEKIISGPKANALARDKIQALRDRYPSTQISTGGGEQERLDTLKDTGRLYLLAIFMVFMAISLSFQSILYPWLVLLVLPFGLVGVVWSLSLHNTPLSLMGLIGVVGLTGVVVNVSIILLSFVQQELKEGMELKEALIAAGVRRLRPIVITSLTTLIGLIPSIYGVGGVDPFVQPLALVLGWGLTMATGLSILILPSLLSFFTILERK